jgi:hypothetical protein
MYFGFRCRGVLAAGECRTVDITLRHELDGAAALSLDKMYLLVEWFVPAPHPKVIPVPRETRNEGTRRLDDAPRGPLNAGFYFRRQPPCPSQMCVGIPGRLLRSARRAPETESTRGTSYARLSGDALSRVGSCRFPPLSSRR